MSNKSGRIDSTVVEDEYLRAIKYQRLKVLNQALLTRVVFEQQNSFRNNVSLCVF